jgi:hypothetical protein
MPLSVALTAICHQNVSFPKCTLPTRVERLRYEEVPENDLMLTRVMSTDRVGDALLRLICMSNGTHISNFPGDMN